MNNQEFVFSILKAEPIEDSSLKQDIKDISLSYPEEYRKLIFNAWMPYQYELNLRKLYKDTEFRGALEKYDELISGTEYIFWGLADYHYLILLPLISDGYVYIYTHDSHELIETAEINNFITSLKIIHYEP